MNVSTMSPTRNQQPGFLSRGIRTADDLVPTVLVSLRRDRWNL